ncbi:homoserine dehydrogenase [Pontibacillus salicampi]|uniref:Homoserine dehydrogenase n=1 Tax=Pontibacillus salicampi TaxID=1449801 RepID=A0ABV6LKC0_9BACI
MTIKVAILGFGTVGEGVWETLHTHHEYIQKKLSTPIEITSILVKDSNKKRNLPDSVQVTTDIEEVFQQPVDVVLEAIVGKQPAYQYVTRAIEHGAHVITANKEMFAHYGPHLLELAKEHNVWIGYEATTAGGTPVIRTIDQMLQVNQIKSIQGIVNGTSNYILTQMTKHQNSFEDALLAAQQKGYAEADPSNDVDGYDAFYKAMILSQLAYQDQPNWDEVYLEGIRTISSQDIDKATIQGQKWKHVATIELRHGAPRASIQPMQLNEDHPLYNIDGVENALSIQTDLLGSITLSGPGAGKLPTASAMIEDLLYVFQKERQQEAQYV